MNLLFPVFSFFARNPVAQAFAAAFALFALWKANNWHVRRGAKQEGAREVIDQIQEQTDERIERAEEVQRSTADLNAEQLRQLASKSRNNRGRVQRSEGD